MEEIKIKHTHFGTDRKEISAKEAHEFMSRLFGKDIADKEIGTDYV